MKQLFVIAGILLSMIGSAQTNRPLKEAVQQVAAEEVPATLLTDANTHWTISTVSTMGYVNTTPGSNYNSYKSGGGMIVKFKFLPNNRYEFQLYVQVNTYGTDTETWTQLNGRVHFSKDKNGQQVFTTHAEKGVYRIVKNGVTTTRPIAANELQRQHSKTYLWERTNLKDDAKNTYLLLVDLDAHPGANVNEPGSIDPSWVSKFHIPGR